MNEQQLQRSEKIASALMRLLAVIGVVAVLALLAWLVVTGIRVLPNAGDGITAAVSAVRSVFSTAPDESLTFALETRTIGSGEPTTVAWDHTGAPDESSYLFSYACEEGLTLSVKGAYGWTDLACGETYAAEDAELLVLPVSIDSRFLDVELTVQSGSYEDTTLATIVNTDVASDSTPSSDALNALGNAQENLSTNTLENVSTNVEPTNNEPVSAPAVTPTPSTPAPSHAVVRTVKPIATGPADLVVNIVETGILVPVEEENTFFPVSPIPSNKTAAIKFTVANRGGAASGAWAFVANLPIEGDANYRYVSPAQNSLASGMQVEFTLGFDEVLEEKSGTIKIELVPTQSSDRTANNTDAVKISIKES